ncbi:glycosyltransferase [Ammonicoccus fulvus]|uniref:Glycosyltransferase n=1 Tax=Ammonicoccus fulvus TaxID=3138240 RepID=A0ABZ3FRF3_9ACTN
MTTILAYTSPAIGHLYPMMPVLLELKNRGHHVHVRTLDRAVPDVLAAGLKAEPIHPAVEPVLEQFPTHAAKGAKAQLEMVARLFSTRAQLDAPDLRKAIDEVQPDLLVVDINAWGAVGVAEASGLPWTSFCPYILSVRSKGTPPFGPGLTRDLSVKGRIRDAVVNRLVLGAVEAQFLPTLNRVRAAEGLSPCRSVDNFFTRAHAILMTSSEPFDYPHPDWPAKIHSIGATPWEPERPEPEWLAELADPLVLVTTSSEYQGDEELARAAIAGLADEPGSVVITMAAGVPDDLGPLPPNIRVERFVPHGHLLKRATVAVTHGGMGATQKALAAGVPVCAMPFGRDQFETAARVVHANAGTRLDAKKLTPDALRDSVRRAARMAGGARRCAEGYANAGGATAGADTIESLLGS